jgi:hypothetical protein
MNSFEEAIRRAGRQQAVGAVNAAIIWQDHPSYNTKTAVLKGLHEADNLLVTIALADGCVGAKTVCGLDRTVLSDATGAVRRFKQGDQSIASVLRGMARAMQVGGWEEPAR